MKKKYLLYVLLVLSNVVVSQTITNVGSKITVTNGIRLNFDNLHNSQAGSVFYYDNDLNISGDWTNIAPATFSQGDDATLTLNGTSQQTIKSGGSTFKNLIVNNTTGNDAEIFLSDNLEVETSLTLTNGIVNTNSNALIIQSTATTTIGNEGSFIDGEIQKIGDAEFIFPCGDVIYRDLNGDDADEYYVIWAPMKSTPVASTTVSVTYFFDKADMPDWWAHGGNMDETLHHVSDREHYIISSTEDFTNITFYWNDNDHEVGGICQHSFCDGDPTTFVPSDLAISYWNGSMWVDAGGSVSGDHNNGSITSGSVIPFGAKNQTFISYGSKNNEIPLPVELLNFVSGCNNSHVELLWTTASEKNNRGFVIEKSLDAESFKEIGFVEGNGNSNQILNYVFTDENPEKAGAYYRLKQIDYDGNYKYIKSIFAYCGKSEDEPVLSIYPNPFWQDVNIVVCNLPIGDKTEVCVYNMLGELIYQTMPNAIDGDFELNVDLEYLPPAMYLVKIISGDYIEVTRIEKK